MIFFKKFLLIVILSLFSLQLSFAEDIKKTIDIEEELPLNNPFQGNLGSNSANNANVRSNNSDELENELSIYNFKLLGIISGKYESYISLINTDGNMIVLQLNEELYEGLKLVDLRLNEAIFKKTDKSYVIINFKNEIDETKNNKFLKLFFYFLILVIGLTGCTTNGKFKKSKPFKHNTPLIKSDIRKAGQTEIAKTIDMGPKPVFGDTTKLEKRKRISSQTSKNYLLNMTNIQS